MVLDRNLQQLQLLSNVYTASDVAGETNDGGMNKTVGLPQVGVPDVDLMNQLVGLDDDQAPWTEIEPSAFAKNTINPIRRIVDAMNVQPNPEKALLKLHIGDPTVTGVLPTHPAVNAAVLEALLSGKYNGYGPAVGFPEVRRALADHINKTCPGSRVTTEDIIMTSGCSHALEMAIEVLANPGANILVPRPGFPLYETLMHPLGVEPRHYDLLAHQNWEIDLKQMESLIDENTAAIVVNNPNNPTGAVYTREHLESILRVAQAHRIPVIADEIYGDMVFGGAHFYPMHTLEPKVPILTCDGISKRYLVPGWRLGWLIVHNVDQAFVNIRIGLSQLAQKIVGPCSLMQGALPFILERTPQDFFQRTRDILEENVRLVCDRLANVPGITPIKAHGAMYMMIKLDTACFPGFRGDDLEFIQALISQESLYCLPGSAFYYPGAIRFVMTHSSESMMEACERLKSFCLRHFKESASLGQEKKSVGKSLRNQRRKLNGLLTSMAIAEEEKSNKLGQVSNEFSAINSTRNSVQAQ